MTRPWTNVYGLGRSVLALGLLSQLLFNGVDVLFRPEMFQAVLASGPHARLNFFILLSESRTTLELARWIAVVALALIVSGWRPRYTGVLHWWLSFSFSNATAIPEGGDQLSAILTLLMVPLTLTDSRRWHWDTWVPRAPSVGSEIRAVVARSCLTMIRLQVAVVYFVSGVAKMSVPEWADGTAVYYWFTQPVYGLNDALKPLIMPVLTNPVGVTILTWGVIIFEVLMGTALVMDRRYSRKLLLPGLAFHFAIVVAHGLFSFFFAMAGALVLYLRPSDEPFSGKVMRRASDWVATIRAVARRRMGRVARPA